MAYWYTGSAFFQIPQSYWTAQNQVQCTAFCSIAWPYKINWILLTVYLLQSTLYIVPKIPVNWLLHHTSSQVTSLHTSLSHKSYRLELVACFLLWLLRLYECWIRSSSSMVSSSFLILLSSFGCFCCLCLVLLDCFCLVLLDIGRCLPSSLLSHMLSLLDVGLVKWSTLR